MRRVTSKNVVPQALGIGRSECLTSPSCLGNDGSAAMLRVPAFSSASASSRQKGAILPIAVFFFFILCAGLLVIYNTAQLTSDKRHLTNAADVIAYSTAAVAAEGLNYTAYTNRAMVANYSGVGHMMGMWSVMAMSDQYWKNISTVVGALGAAARFIPWIGPTISAVAKAFSTFGENFQKITRIIRWGTKMMANLGTAAVSLTNYAIFTSQQVHLASTVAAMMDMQNDLLQANAPNAEYEPTTVAYQVVKSIIDFWKLMKPHRAPGHFVEQMNSKAKKNKGEKFNLVHRLMMTELFIMNNPLNGRMLLPNAVGLWMSDGCHFGMKDAVNGVFTGATHNGLVSIFPALADSNWAAGLAGVIEAFMNTVGLLASPITCMFNRVGGTRIFQNQNGSYGWASFDVMPMKLLRWNISLAGGVTVSKLGDGNNDREIPQDLEDFVRYGERTPAVKNKYWGETTTPDDCMYMTLPTGDVWEPRVGGGMCLSLAPGSAKKYKDRGILNEARKAAWDAMRSTPASRQFADQMTEPMLAPVSAMLEQVESNIVNAATTTFNPSTGANVAGGQVSGGVPAGMPASGSALNPPTPGSAADANNIRNQFQRASGRLTANGAFYPNWMLFRDALTNPSNFRPPPDEQNSGPGGFFRFLLSLLGLEDLVDIFKLRSSRGTETLGYMTKKGKHFTPDLGLPAERAWLWEMWDAENGLYETGDLDNSSMLAATPEIQEAALHDLGPTFTVGLRQPINATQTANTKGIGNAKLKMPDWERADDTYIRSVGKARVYFRSPVERWTTRQQLAMHATLMLPYWNVKLEGISYPEKALFSFADAMYDL